VSVRGCRACPRDTETAASAQSVSLDRIQQILAILGSAGGGEHGSVTPARLRGLSSPRPGHRRV